jgi:DNA-binding GntR family transcriptional regulator
MMTKQQINQSFLKQPARSRVSTLMRRIEEDINLGGLAAGTWLKQIDLERAYKSSRIDLREALDRLSEKGLVRLESNRGYRVVQMDERRLKEILRVRAVLEIEAAEEIVDKFDYPSLHELEHLASAFEDRVLHGTPVEQERANRAFHAAMLRRCSNLELVELIFELRNRAPLPSNRNNTHARLLRSVKEHFQIIDCLRAWDQPQLVKITRLHVLGEQILTEKDRKATNTK